MERGGLMEGAAGLFSRERYAMETTGIKIELAEPGRAVCSLETAEKHKNSLGVVMGGALYTLADLAFAVAANTGQPKTVTLDGQITYLRPVSGGRITAETFCEKQGERVFCCRVELRDQEGRAVASARFTGLRG